MKSGVVCACALCILAVCGVLLPAGPVNASPARADVALLGDNGFSAPIIGSGSAMDTAPMMLAKKKSKKKKKKGDDDVAGDKSGAVRVDPNTAKLSELKVLPLVDEQTAQAIIAHRPYKSAEDLINVPEVGPSKYRIFKHLIEIKQPEVTLAEVSTATGAEVIENAP
ncbi:MAG: helix-hairpin-helix domain-containing protein [Chlamydiota bacterium]